MTAPPLNRRHQLAAAAAAAAAAACMRQVWSRRNAHMYHPLLVALIYNCRLAFGCFFVSPLGRGRLSCRAERRREQEEEEGRL